MGWGPSFIAAGWAEKGVAYDADFGQHARSSGGRVGTGVFRTHMEVSLVKNGPVTILLDSCERGG